MLGISALVNLILGITRNDEKALSIGVSAATTELILGTAYYCRNHGIFRRSARLAEAQEALLSEAKEEDLEHGNQLSPRD